MLKNPTSIRRALLFPDFPSTVKSIVLTIIYCFSIYRMGYVLHDSMAISAARVTVVALSVYSINLLLLSVLRNRYLQISYYVLFVSFLLSNLLYYRYFEVQIHLGQIFAIGNLPQVSGYALSLLRTGDIAFALGLAALVLLTLIKRGAMPNVPGKALLILIILLSLLRVGIHIPFGAYKSGTDFVKQAKFFFHSDSHLFTLRFGFSVGFVSDLFQLASNNSSESKLDGVKDYLARISESGSISSEKKPNIIIIQLESIDFKLIGLRYKGVEITPFMNRLMKDSFSFSNYYTVRYTGSTSDAEFTILTSMHPLTDIPSFYAKGFERIPSLPTVLSIHSYETAAFHANKASFWGRSNAFGPLGINKYYSLKDYDDLPRSKSGTVPDKYFLKRTLDIISEMPEPFYAHVLTISSHGPYNRLEFEIEEDMPRYRDLTGDRFMNNYFRIAGHVDSQLEEFVSSLRHIFEDHVIVIVGDHTAQIKRDSYSSRGSGPGKVPFFIISSRGGRHREVRSLGSHLDVAPTILGLTAISAPSSWQGRDLLNASGARERMFFKQPLLSVDPGGNFSPVKGQAPDSLYMAERFLWH